jgi:hypothetical protein
MKQPPAFKMGEPSYLTVASTSGNESPTSCTVLNASRARGIAAKSGVRAFIAAILAEVARRRE